MSIKGKLILCAAAIGISALAFFSLNGKKSPVAEKGNWQNLAIADGNVQVSLKTEPGMPAFDSDRETVMNRADLIKQANAESKRRRLESLREINAHQQLSFTQQQLQQEQLQQGQFQSQPQSSNETWNNGTANSHLKIVKNKFLGSDTAYRQAALDRQITAPIPKNQDRASQPVEQPQYSGIQTAQQSASLLDEMMISPPKNNFDLDQSQQVGVRQEHVRQQAVERQFPARQPRLTGPAEARANNKDTFLPQEVSVISEDVFLSPPQNNLNNQPATRIQEPQLHPPLQNRSDVPQNQSGNQSAFPSSTSGVQPAFQNSVKIQTVITPAIYQQVIRQVEYGKTLARRGATYAARDEFVSALRLISEALDQQTGTREFSSALSEGFTALDEAEDFVNRDGQGQVVLQISRIAGNHRTIVLKNNKADQYTPQQAMQEYYAHAERRLTEASGGHSIASTALHALGKSFGLPSEIDGNNNTMQIPKAMIMYRTAIAIDQLDYQSRNELAVLLARNGQLEVAKQHLLSGLRIQQTPAAWHNLTMIHNALGEYDFARRAEQQFRMAQNQMPADDSSMSVRWVSAEQMNELSLPMEKDLEQTTRTAQNTASQESQPPKKGWLKPLKDWF